MKQSKNSNKKEYIDLSDVLYICFAKLVGTEEECKLHEDSFVTKTLKKYLGKKEFDLFDSMDENYWKNSWRKFDSKAYFNE